MLPLLVQRPSRATILLLILLYRPQQHLHLFDITLKPLLLRKWRYLNPKLRLGALRLLLAAHSSRFMPWPPSATLRRRFFVGTRGNSASPLPLSSWAYHGGGWPCCCCCCCDGMCCAGGGSCDCAGDAAAGLADAPGSALIPGLPLPAARQAPSVESGPSHGIP